VGAGYLDIQAALADDKRFRGTAHSPVAVRTQAGSGSQGGAAIVCDSASICEHAWYWNWNLQSIWGDQSIWGGQSIWGDQTSIAVNGEQ
jgi:hypothetical protein